MRQTRMSLLSVFILAVSSSSAYAHPGHTMFGRGIAAGFTHPLLGIDHLLAMVTVGLLSAQVGGRAIWTIPGSFLICMVGGGILGMKGWETPIVEYGIAASVILLGLAVALNRRFNLAAPMAFAGIFGLFHGYAHGMEMPSISNPGLYALGFVAATLGLHVVGIVVGKYAIHSVHGTKGLRLSGAAISCMGIWFALTV